MGSDVVVADVTSIGWLWQVVGATCCWAMSDVICDACIRPASPKREDKCITADAPEVIPSPNPARARKRLVQVSLLGAPQAINDCTTSGKLDLRETRLSPEQNAFLSGLVSLVTVSILSSISGVTAKGDIFENFDTRQLVPAIGGCVHFTSYFLTLCAFSSASSTVITPLMQLSAVWMLPFSTLAAALGYATFIRPIHLLSVILICAGGFLPAADGQLTLLLSARFWKQRAVRLVLLGELLVCFYNLLLHQATFSGSNDNVIDTFGDDVPALRFFLVSRLGNGLTCLSMYFFVPNLRSHVARLRFVNPKFLMIALSGECLSMVGICLVTFSYSSFYEPSVVNAAEGGLQQLFNLLFALTSRRVLGLGREVDRLNVKCVSFALVASGLTLSTA